MPSGPARPHRPGFFDALAGGLLRPRHALVPAELDGGRALTEAAIRALAQPVPMAGNTLLCRTLGRYKLLVDAGDLTHAPHLALDGFWEWWTTRYLTRTLRPGMRVVDAGAAYGYFTTLAAELVGPEGHVLAIEPEPRSAELLRRNIALNGQAGRVRVEEAALVAHGAPRALRLLSPQANPTAAHVPAADLHGPRGVRAAPVGGTTLVAARPLDALDPGMIDVVKLDVSGAEEAAYEGMQGMLAANPAAVLLVSFAAHRLLAPDAFLARLAGRAPLRRLNPLGFPVPVTPEEALAGGEVMLCLAP